MDNFGEILAKMKNQNLKDFAEKIRIWKTLLNQIISNCYKLFSWIDFPRVNANRTSKMIADELESECWTNVQAHQVPEPGCITQTIAEFFI